MGNVRLTGKRRALAGYILGVLLVVAGVYVARGLAASLVVGGIICALSFLLLADVGEESVEPPAASTEPTRRFFEPTL